MRFATEGRPFIFSAGVLAAGLWALGLGLATPWLTALAGLATLLLAFVAYFFRDPERQASGDEGLVLAPADGRVLSIDEITEPSFLEGACRRISIFLSVFNVHVQRAPLAGKVTHRSYRPGGYAVAWKPKASEENEQASLGLETEHGRVLVRQIAGLVARRIVTYPDEGDHLSRGQRIGIIRFGSRVDLFMPLDWSVECGVGDAVRGGATPMARVAVRSRATEPGPVVDTNAPSVSAADGAGAGASHGDPGHDGDAEIQRGGDT